MLQIVVLIPLSSPMFKSLGLKKRQQLIYTQSKIVGFKSLNNLGRNSFMTFWIQIAYVLPATSTTQILISGCSRKIQHRVKKPFPFEVLRYGTASLLEPNCINSTKLLGRWGFSDNLGGCLWYVNPWALWEASLPRKKECKFFLFYSVHIVNIVFYKHITFSFLINYSILKHCVYGIFKWRTPWRTTFVEGSPSLTDWNEKWKTKMKMK